MLRYAITGGDAAGFDEEILAHARQWAVEGVEFVQLREKQLGAGELVRLARAMMEIFGEYGGRTKLLVNERADVAVAAGADGVHLTARTGELTAEQVRQVFAACGHGAPVVSVSCHSVAEVRRAVAVGVDLVLFGPVFEKRVNGSMVVSGVGLESLREACGVAGEVSVLALGGVTVGSAELCIEVGASGVAGIRLFA